MSQHRQGSQETKTYLHPVPLGYCICPLVLTFILKHLVEGTTLNEPATQPFKLSYSRSVGKMKRTVVQKSGLDGEFALDLSDYSVLVSLIENFKGTGKEDITKQFSYNGIYSDLFISSFVMKEYDKKTKHPVPLFIIALSNLNNFYNNNICCISIW